MKQKISLDDQMKVKIEALKPNGNPFLQIKTRKQMSACYRAAEKMGCKIERIANWAGTGWLVRRIS